MELPVEIERAVRRFEPIFAEGLTLYPVRVKEYDAWCVAKDAVEALQQAFPARLMSMPILSAMYRMDLEAMRDGTDVPGLFPRALLALALSLRLWEGRKPEERVKAFRIEADAKDPGRLLSVRCTLNGEEMVKITPIQFQRIRPILAAQNGAERYADDANPELVQAEREMAELNGPKLDLSIEDMQNFVAAWTGADERTTDEWPILKLFRRAEGLKRPLDYLICGIGETQGTKWKGGNPAPHPCFARKKEGSAALRSIEEFSGNAVMPLRD